MASPKIKHNPIKDAEQKAKEDYAAQAFPHTEGIILPDGEAYKKRVDKVEEKEVKNFNVNFISDEDFEKEVEYLPYTPQGEVVIVLGPKVKLSEAAKGNALTLDEKTKRELLADQLGKHKAGYRVVAVSPQVVSQIAVQIAQMLPIERGLDTQSLVNLLEIRSKVIETSFYSPGTYVFSKPGANGLQVVREILQFQPLNEDFSYYEVYHREVNGFMTQAQVLRFKPVEDDKEPQA